MEAHLLRESGACCHQSCAQSIQDQLRKKYFVQNHADFEIPAFTAERIFQAISAMPDNTPVLDGFATSDLQCCSFSAAHWLGALYNTIEQGASWAETLKYNRTAFLGKGGDPLSPLDYRGLTMLSKVWRLYGSIRHQDLKEWASTWASDDMFAGTFSPIGAEDAWWLTALLVEKLNKSATECPTQRRLRL